MVKLAEETKTLILNGNLIENGRIPFDKIQITEEQGAFVFTYFYKGKLLFSQDCHANLNAGAVITLSDHIGSLGVTISS